MRTYVAKAPMQQWTCGDTLTELRGGQPRALPIRETQTGVELTWSDYLAGAGGSSWGIELVPGAGVVMAVNHWWLAVETHQTNLPWADHDVANVARVDPRRYRKTDMAWFSPECTKWSIAAGKKCDYDSDWDQPTLAGLEGDDPETPEAKEAKWRSRMLMRDVIRFAEVHRYRGVIVENVPDILKWSAFDRWLGDMRKLGYRHKVITLNSAFAAALGAPAPQLRDRVYVVFWQSRYSTPNWDKWLRPQAWCPRCEQVVRAVYTAKPGPRRPMRYGPRSGQYFYRCPALTCRGVSVEPLVMPARSAIDVTLPTQRIGDRKRPLAAATYERVRVGVERYLRSAAAAMPALTTPENDALVVPTKSRDGLRARPVTEPMRTQTGQHEDALVVPLRNNGVAAPAALHPLHTVAAAGTHHALVMRNNQGGAEMVTPVGEPVRTLTTAGHQSLLQLVVRQNNCRGDQAAMSTPLDEPLRTLLAEGGRQSLVQVLYGYDTGQLRPLADPLPTQTTVEGDALLGAAVNVDDCTLRMLAVKEIQAGMAFTPTYRLLGNAMRDKVRMLGNAVTPPAARDLAACLMEAITGAELTPAC